MLEIDRQGGSVVDMDILRHISKEIGKHGLLEIATLRQIQEYEDKL